MVGDDAEGRTTCYNPKAHSVRRKTCNLLLDPDNPLHDFEPGLYLVPGPRFRDQTLVCSAVDIIMVDTENVDTRRAPPTQPVVVLGPFVHPVTGLLTVKCILLSALENTGTIGSFGQAFQTLDMSERGAMVPDPDMITDLIHDIEQAYAPNVFDDVIDKLERVNHQLTVNETRLDNLDNACFMDTDLQKRVRTICKCFYDMALYFRRYAGPGRKVPLDLLQGVGHASNPLSSSLEGKFVTSTMTGVRLTANGSGEAQSADYVMQPEGTLTNMSQANAHTILMIYDSLTANQKALVRKVFQLGTPFRIINGNGRFYLDDSDPNRYNGNLPHMAINLFDMCFGDHTHARGFYAMSSVHGTRTYCVQIAAIQIVRTVQTILPYIYKSRPAWALVDGEFDNVHTPP